MNTWFKLLLISALLGFGKAHYFIRAVILAALGLAGLWMVHTLAQDFSSIQNNINAGRDGDAATDSGGFGGFRGLFKRSIVGTNDISRNSKQINWEMVLSRDPAGCARSFLCQLAATKEEFLSTDEKLMLELVRHSAKEDTPASEQLRESLKNGEKVGTPSQCMTIYKFCPYTSQMMMTLLKLFGR